MNLTSCPGKREQNKQANRIALLNAARRCFLEMGYEAVTVRDIVRLTDLASGTFYNYFPDKESMFREILEVSVNDLNGKLREERQQAQSIEAFIRGAYLIMFRKISVEPDFFNLILRNEHAVRSLFRDTVIGMPMRAMKEDIRDAIRRGVFPDVDVNLLAAAFYGTAFEVGRVLVEHPGTSPDSAAEFATTLLTSGVRALGSERSVVRFMQPVKQRNLGLP
jgi:AcrR family transcriptional regulator